MNEILNKRTIKRVEESLKKFDAKIKIKFLSKSLRDFSTLFTVSLFNNSLIFLIFLKQMEYL